MADIVKTDDVLDGKARLAGRRVSVFQIGKMYTRAGHSAESIADQLDLAFAEVHRAPAYYYAHPEEMEEIKARRESRSETLADRSVAPEELSR